ncbi:MAG: hypothetical protein MJZ73_09290 [Bacteroidaceae bacterium]|nr:hypothetical protein [Bacteroidaceae bacterium]
MGDFSVSLTSKGAESADKFSAQNITGVNVVWDCGTEFKNLLNDAEFNLVASRKAQEAVLKAIKAGETVVDLTNPDGSPDGSPSDGQQSESPNGGQQSTDNGQQTPSGGNGSNQQTGGGTTDQGGVDDNNPPAFG